MGKTKTVALFAWVLMLPILSACTRVLARPASSAVEDVPVRAARVLAEDVPFDILAVGNAEASQTVEVKSRAAGQIASVAFQEGQSVTRGQTLFTLDPRGLESQAAELRALVARDAAMEQQARANTLREAAAHTQSELDAGIARKLGALGVLSQQRVDQVSTASATSLASLESNEAGLKAAVGASRADQARLAQMQLQLSFTRIVAPISGRAGAILIKAGNMVRENDTTLVTLLQSSPIQVSFGIPEQNLAEIRRLQASQRLQVEVNTESGTRVPGKLAFIDNTVDPATGTVRLKAVLANADYTLWPGEFVHVRLRLRMETNKLVLPESAIQDGLDGKFVWLIRANTVSVAPVQVERSYQPWAGPAQAVVAAGVRPGDLIVTEGQLRLTEGARISLDAASRSNAGMSGSSTAGVS